MGKRIALVMAGGGGTRLWPASTRSRPKPLLDPLLGSTERQDSLVAQTVQRVSGLVDPRDIWVVAAQGQIEGLRQALGNIDADRFIAEPQSRSTAPCVGLSLVHLRAALGSQADDTTVMVLPADHHIADPEGFRDLLAVACAHAQTANCVVTLGIEPDRPATEFGYIERSGEPLTPIGETEAAPVFRVARFVEKPDKPMARNFLATGRFVWNAGIFVMPIARIEREFARLCSPTWHALAQIPIDSGDTSAIEQATATAYESIESASIDRAIMERLDDLRVIPARVGWTDLGSWLSVYELAEHDTEHNAVVHRGQRSPVLVDTARCLAWSDGPQIALVGVTDLAVIASGKNLLVCHLDQVQAVRKVVEQLRTRGKSAEKTGADKP